MKLTIGVLGSTTRSGDDVTREKLVRLGRTIAERGHALLTAARPGLHHAVVQGARHAGGLVVGISPARSTAEHLEQYGWPTQGFDTVVCTGAGPAGCEIEGVRSSDVVIVVDDRAGRPVELGIAYDEGRPIGVLTRTRGIADAVEGLARVCGKPGGGPVLCDEDPARLVDRLIECHQARHTARPGRSPAPLEPPVAESAPGRPVEERATCDVPEWGAGLLRPRVAGADATARTRLDT